MKILNKTRFTLRILLLTSLLVFIAINFNSLSTFADSNDDFTLVGLKYGSTAVDTVSLQSEKGFMIGSMTGKLLTETNDYLNINNIQVMVSNGKLDLVGTDGNLPDSLNENTELIILSSNFEDNGIIFCNNLPYRGGIVLRVNSQGKINVINRLKNDEYLYGVVHMEMSQANPIEALKAQAVAARNFLYLSRDRHSKDGFEVCNSTHCQVFGGYIKEYVKTNQAVDETRDQLIYYNNIPINAYYHKNSGGFTQDSETVWSSFIGYLRSVKDSYSPVYQWSYSYKKEDIKQKLADSGLANIGNIQSVGITGINDDGYVSELEFIGSQGNIKLSKEKTRAVLGYTNIKSMNFTIGGDGFATSILGSNESMVSAETFHVQSINSDDIIIDSGSMNVINGEGRISKISNIDSSLSDVIVFNGSGYGHGIGMSQDGAIEMAKEGYTYKDILEFYYTGVEIR